tara:strand:+ start:582 stop:1031 length:450 start_codon:yes stop_codon:yes gene_type:complete
MEIKKSTVKQVQASGTWDGKFGVMYKYEVLMTNGDAGQYLSKSQSQDKFIQGGVVDYQYTSGDFPKIKPHFEQNYGDKFGVQNPVTQSPVVKQQTNDTQTQIIRQSSIRTAAEHCKGDCSIEDLIDNAEMIFNWCVDGSKPTISNEKPF